MEPLTYDQCTTEQQDRFDQAIDLAVTWYNMHPQAIEMGLIDRDPKTWDGNPPLLLWDEPFGYYRAIAFEIDFFGDEGGPAQMLVLYDHELLASHGPAPAMPRMAYWQFDTEVDKILDVDFLIVQGERVPLKGGE